MSEECYPGCPGCKLPPMTPEEREVIEAAKEWAVGLTVTNVALTSRRLLTAALALPAPSLVERLRSTVGGTQPTLMALIREAADALEKAGAK